MQDWVGVGVGVRVRVRVRVGLGSMISLAETCFRHGLQRPAQSNYHRYQDVESHWRDLDCFSYLGFAWGGVEVKDDGKMERSGGSCVV